MFDKLRKYLSLTACLLLISSSTIIAQELPGKPGWKLIVGGAMMDIYSVLSDRQFSGSNVINWENRVFKQPITIGNETARSSLVKTEYNCATKTARSLEGIMYRGQYATEPFIATPAGDWVKLAEGGMGMAVLNIVCKR